jgi:hypothetical protein
MKSLLLLPMLMLGILFTGCKKEEIIQTVPNRTIFFEVLKGSWRFDASSQSNIAEIPVPEIDDYANQNSGILVYISDDGETYEAIPDVFYGSTFTYRYGIGKLWLETQGATGGGIAAPDRTIYVKVVIVEADPI